jgi:hypothetical protein
MNDPMTVATWVAFGFAVLFVLGVILWAALHKRPAGAPILPAAQPYSISRAMDELKHYHADQVIGQALGVAQASSLGSVLGPLSKPPEPPKA